MRRMTMLFGTVCLLSVGTIATVVACGDDDSAGAGAANIPDGAAGETGAATSSSGAGSTSGTSGTSSSSGEPADGGTSSSSGGSLASNPAQYTCGSTTCDAGFTGGGPNVCCQAANETNTKCTTRNACDNTGSNGNLRVQCDETADCPASGPGGGDICCYFKDQSGPGGSVPSFTASCMSRQECRSFTPGQGAKPRPQLCKTSAECGDAGACNLKTCDGFKLNVCGSPAGCQ